LRIVPGHARDWRFAEEELDRQVLAMFKGMRVDDDEARQWFVDVLKSRASFVHAQERENRTRFGSSKRSWKTIAGTLRRFSSTVCWTGTGTLRVTKRSEMNKRG